MAMTDIVERLRTEALSYVLIGDAAIEIERLRKALEVIASGKFSGITLTSYPPQDPAVNYARAALEGK